MAKVIPFAGTLYNSQKVAATSVTAPPYDIVTPELKETLYKRSPYNIIRIDFGKESKDDNENENRYTRASSLLNDWIQQEILIKDSEASFYCYEAEYSIQGQEKRLRGFFGAVLLEELGSGKIHPHEMTYSKPKSDRLNILRYCRANISPIFSLYSSKEKRASSILEKIIKNNAPLLEAENGDGFKHRLWRIQEKSHIKIIKRELSDKDIFIADGHHRYETALDFKHEMKKKRKIKTGKELFNFVMMLLVNMEEDGLTVLPTHRLANFGNVQHIRNKLIPFFNITTLCFNDSTIDQAKEDMFRNMKKRKNSFGMYVQGQMAFHVFAFKGSYEEVDSHQSLKDIDATILHKFIYEKILKIHDFAYEMDADLVIDKVRNGPFQTAFFLNPTSVKDVKKVALTGQRMPPKSTYFYPKLLTGMVIYTF
jgi:uncharacterized protein (DUF1015 family)